MYLGSFAPYSSSAKLVCFINCSTRLARSSLLRPSEVRQKQAHQQGDEAACTTSTAGVRTRSGPCAVLSRLLMLLRPLPMLPPLVPLLWHVLASVRMLGTRGWDPESPSNETSRLPSFVEKPLACGTCCSSSAAFIWNLSACF
jgi:hypothetical protein